MNNQNSPQGQGSFSMQAPAQVSNKLDSVELLPAGPNPGILYSLVDMGTHYNEHFQKKSRIIRLTFEFPLFKQLFRTTDKVKRPTVLSMEETFQMAERSNLKKFCEGALGRSLNPEEYKNGYDVGQFLNKIMIVTVVNKQGKKDTTKTYNNIGSVQGLTEHSRTAYNFDWDNVVRTNDIVGFMIDPAGECFKSQTFAEFPDWIRNRILGSDEARSYVSKGGVVIEKKKREPDSGYTGQLPPNAPPPATRTPSNLPIVNGHLLTMIVEDFTYEQYLGAGHTAETLVAQGKAEWTLLPVQSTPEAPKVPQAPLAPEAPQVPEDDPNEVPF